jgi:Xaa-Pro aminopeptidase
MSVVNFPQHFGTPTKEEKHAFTRVLQGHIAIDEAVFPTGTTGASIRFPISATHWI